MYGSEPCIFSFGWIVPIIMMLLCFLMMRRRRGATMCGGVPRSGDGPPVKTGDSAMDILDRQYASGDIDTTEYEEKKRVLAYPAGLDND